MNLNAFLSHIDLLPIIYAISIAAGMLMVWAKLITGHWKSVSIDVSVFILIFWMHGGSMTGAFAATIAAPLVCIGVPLVSWIVAGRR